jgi:hypothetical protein
VRATGDHPVDEKYVCLKIVWQLHVV